MSPYQHGEVFVTDDGAETDLDLGHYERFIDEDLNQLLQPDHGQGLLERAEQGAPGRLSGRDRPGHPPHHRRDQELHLHRGRTAPGPTWSSPRSAAPPATSRASPSWRPSARWAWSWAASNCCFIHVALVPYISGSGEHKTKPTQHSGQGAAGHGHQPGHHRRRAPTSPLSSDIRRQDQHCSATSSPDCVIENLTVPSPLRGAR